MVICGARAELSEPLWCVRRTKAQPMARKLGFGSSLALRLH